MSNSYYQRKAASYEKDWQQYTQVTTDKVLSYLPDLTGQTVLDVGCGTGVLIRKLLLRFPAIRQVVGHDPQEEMIREARKKLRILPPHLQEKVRLQTAHSYDVSFDTILCSNTLHYFSTPVEELRYWRSLLHPDGMLVVEDYSKQGWIVNYFEWAFRWIDAGHQRAYTLAEITPTFAQAGFVVDRSETFVITHGWRGFIIRAKPVAERSPGK